MMLVNTAVENILSAGISNRLQDQPWWDLFSIKIKMSKLLSGALWKSGIHTMGNRQIGWYHVFGTWNGRIFLSVRPPSVFAYCLYASLDDECNNQNKIQSSTWLQYTCMLNTLKAWLIHVLVGDELEVPRSRKDSTKFYCLTAAYTVVSFGT